MGRPHEPAEGYHGERDIDAWTDDLRRRIDEGEVRAVGEALDFLERDPYFFRSGYARGRVARMVARAPLTPAQRSSARALVLSSVDGDRHCPHPGLGRLARAVADNQLRRELRDRLHHPDQRVARRALAAVVSVRAPGYTLGDLAAARAITLRQAAEGGWLSPTVAGHAAYLWSSEWAEELRSAVLAHGAERAGARRLLDDAARRRVRREEREAAGRPGP